MQEFNDLANYIVRIKYLLCIYQSESDLDLKKEISNQIIFYIEAIKSKNMNNLSEVISIIISQITYSEELSKKKKKY